MWFKNLIAYRFAPNPTFTNGGIVRHLTLVSLRGLLDTLQLQPCGPLQKHSSGFVPPGNGQLVEGVGNNFLLIALGVEEKVLPAATVKAQVADRAKALASEQEYPCGRRQLREIKERVTDELLAKAFTKRRTTRAWLDLDAGWLVVDATSEGRAEELVSALREALGTFPVRPLETEHTPAGAAGQWLINHDAPGRFSLDSDLELQGIHKPHSAVKYSRGEIDGPEILGHLKTKLVKRLGLSWADKLFFNLTDTLALRKVAFIGVKPEAAESEGADVQREAELLLMCGETKLMLEELVTALGGEVQS